jgi:hypothetical protein
MVEPGWMTFYTAADGIRKHFDCGWAEAKATLRSACADQAIDTMKAPLDPDVMPREMWTPIAPSKWHEGQPDHDDGPDADGCKVVVMLNKDDFDRWLLRQPQPQSLNRPRDVAIRKRLTAGQRPPHSISWKEFCNVVRDDADGWIGDKLALGFSQKQIERAVKDIALTIRPKAIFLQRRTTKTS